MASQRVGVGIVIATALTRLCARVGAAVTGVIADAAGNLPAG